MYPLFLPAVPPLAIFGGLLTLTFTIKYLIKTLVGKTFCIVGPALSGKTTFIEWLKHKEFVKVSERTVRTEGVKIGKIPVGSGEITIRTVIDTPGQLEIGGGKIFYDEINGNDRIIFFFDVSEFINNKIYRTQDVCPRLKTLAERVNKKTPKLLIFVGTHADKVSNLNTNETEIKFRTLINADHDSSFLFDRYKLIICDLQKKDSFKSILEAIKDE